MGKNDSLGFEGNILCTKLCKWVEWWNWGVHFFLEKDALKGIISLWPESKFKDNTIVIVAKFVFLTQKKNPMRVTC